MKSFVLIAVVTIHIHRLVREVKIAEAWAYEAALLYSVKRVIGEEEEKAFIEEKLIETAVHLLSH